MGGSIRSCRAAKWDGGTQGPVTALSVDTNNRQLHWNNFLAAKDKCKSAPTSAGCQTIERMGGTQSQVLDFLALPDANVVANFGGDGRVISYTLLDKQTNQPTMIMEPLEFEAYRNATAGIRALMLHSPQWALDAASASLYAGIGNVDRAGEHANLMLTDPAMWAENAIGFAGGVVVGSAARGVAGKIPNVGNTSTAGLDWTRISARTGGDAAEHVALNHGSLRLSKPTQGVFYGNPVSTVEDAWAIAQRNDLKPVTVGNRDIYVVPRPNSGYAGGIGGQLENYNHVTIFTETGTNRVITAYPSGGIPPLPKGYNFLLRYQ